MFCSVHDFTFLMTDTKIKEQVSFESWENEVFLCVIFEKICYVACAINRTGKLIYLHACLHEHNRAGLFDKPMIPAWFLALKRIFVLSIHINFLCVYGLEQ